MVRRLAQAWLPAAMLAGLGCAPSAPAAVAPLASPAPTAPPGPQLNPAALGPAGSPGRLLLAVYVLGSDLEDDLRPRNGTPDEAETGALNRRGQATADLGEIAAALGAMAPAERARLDVLVAFGGARQTGWQGLKVLDADGLVRDAEDGYFGNDARPSAYLADEPGADLSQGATFQGFLQRVQARAQGSARVMLEVWNHGGAYAGVGPDRNTGGSLSLEAIHNALEVTRFRADLLGFDACLMASVEVAAAVDGHFAYMVGSAETEPSHGWDYRAWLPAVARRPDATLAEVGAIIVDAYLASPAHRRGRGLTGSVINVPKAAALTGPLDALAQALAKQPDAAARAIDAAENAPAYGRYGDDLAVSIDLAAFADGLGTEAGAALARAARASIVYAREDGMAPGTTGLSTFALHNREALVTGKFTRANATSQAWFGFADGLFAIAATDLVPPGFGAEEPAYVDDRPGWNVVTTDDVGLHEVVAVHAVLEGGRWLMAESDHATHDPVLRDRYFLPRWDGRVLRMGGQLVTLELHARLTATRIYMSPVIWDGGEADLFLKTAPGGEIAEAWVVPDAPADRALLAERAFDLAPGDTLAFRDVVLDDQLRTTGKQLTAAMTFQSIADFRWEPAAGAARLALVASDLHGNRSASPPKPIPAPVP